MVEKSLVDYAYDVLQKKNEAISFRELFDETCALSGLHIDEANLKSRLARFYTQLSLDGRFIFLVDNLWDLRSRHLYKEAQLGLDEGYSDEDPEEEEDIDEEELDEDELAENGELDDDDDDVDDEDFSKVVKETIGDYE